MAGFILVVVLKGKYWSSLLVLIPVIALLAGLALEAMISLIQAEQRKSFVITTATLMFFFGPLLVDRVRPQLYQVPHYETESRWNIVLERLLASVDTKRGALIIGENSQIPPAAVNVALMQRFRVDPEILYRPSLQGTVTSSGERISNATETYNEIARWLQNELVGSVNTIELLPGHPFLDDSTFRKEESWSQAWVELMKSQPWYPETNTIHLEDQKIVLHTYSRDIKSCRIGRSRRIDGPYAGITRMALLDDAGRHTTYTRRGRPMQVQTRVVNLMNREMRGSLWWMISDRFAKRPWEEMWTEARQALVLPPHGQEEITSTLVMPDKAGEYWLVVYLQAEDGTHLDAAFLAEDVYVE